MPIGGVSTFDGNPNASPPVTTPYRPGKDDLGGLAWQDRADFPPNQQTMPSAAWGNELGANDVVFGRSIPVARLSVTGGAPPVFASFTAAPTAVATQVATATFTIVRNGAGDVSITWPANTFPPAITAPSAYLNVQLGAHNYGIGVVAIANGVRVTTVQDGALTDLSFTVEVW